MATNSFAGTALGEEYDLFYKSTPHCLLLEKELADWVDIGLMHAAERRVLEIGSGSGVTMQHIFDACKNISYTGVDNSPEMIVQALARIEQKDLRATLVECDALDFLGNIRSDAYPVITTAFTVHNMAAEYRAKLFPHIYRALAPGGTFVIVDKIVQDDVDAQIKDLAWQLRALDVYDSMGRSDYKDKWVEHYLYDEQPGIKFTEDEFHSLASKAGFKEAWQKNRYHMDTIFVVRK